MFEKEVLFLLSAAGIVIFSMIYIRNLYTILIVCLVVISPLGQLSIMPREVMGVRGLNLVNIVWAVSAMYTISLIILHKTKWYIVDYLKGPIIIIIAVYFIAAIRTLLDLDSIEGAHAMTSSRIFPLSIQVRIIEDLIKPFLIISTGWMVLAYCHHVGSSQNIKRALMISAVVLALLVVGFYLWGALETGHYSDARLYISRNFGMHGNMTARIALGLFLAILFVKTKEWPFIRLIALLGVLLIMTVSLSRAVYLMLIVMIFLHVKDITSGEKKILAVMFCLILIVFSGEMYDRIKYGIVENSEYGGNSSQEIQEGVDVNRLSAMRMDHIWVYLFPMIEDKPFLGSGLHAIRKSDGAQKGLILSLSPHSAVMEVLIDAGFVGLLLLMYAFFWMYRQAKEFKNELYYLILPAVILGISDPTYYPKISFYLLYIFYALHRYDIYMQSEKSNVVEN